LQQNSHAFTPPRKSTSIADLLPLDLSDELSFQDLTSDDDSAMTQIHSNRSSDAENFNPNPHSTSESIHIPNIR
jgi:hypothetical protein